MLGLQIGASVISPLSISANCHTAPQRPKLFSSGAGLQPRSQNRTQGPQGLHEGIKSPLLSAIYSRFWGQGRKGRKGRKNYGPKSCVTCGTCGTGSVYRTFTNRCPLLR